MTLVDFGITENKLFALTVLYFLLFALLSALALAFFYLKGFGIYKMSRKLNIKKSWYAFLPFANIYAFGRVADFSGKGKSFYRKVLTVIYCLSVIFSVAGLLLGFKFAVKLLFAADAALYAGTALNPNIFEGLLPTVLSILIALILNILYGILSAVAAFKIYKRFNLSAPLFSAVFGFIIPLLVPCFLYTACKNDPVDSDYDDSDDDGSVFKIDG